MLRFPDARRQSRLACALVVIAALGSLGAGPTESVTVRVVKEIAPGRQGSYPSSLTAVGRWTFFAADDKKHGYELWRSDGTRAGTRLIKDINPGLGDAWETEELEPGEGPQLSIAGVGRTVFFGADDGRHGAELWRSDGTPRGTRLVKDIYVGPEGYVSGMQVVGGIVLFNAYDRKHGFELWRTDGTTRGTRLVRDINPGPASSGHFNITVLGSALFFVASDGRHGEELWRSDGTRRGTRLVRDINPGRGGSLHGPATNVADVLLFSARDGTSTGHALWRSDGTAAGTYLVKDINPGRGGSYIEDMATVGQTAYFTASDDIHGTELWRSDGTEPGTQLVKDINPGVSDAFGSWDFSDLTEVGGALFFVAWDGMHGSELWRSDGTEAGTAIVKDINPSTAIEDEADELSIGPAELTNVAGTLFFTGSTSVSRSAPRRLWRSDGTNEGTVPVSSIVRSPSSLTAIGSTLFFAASQRRYGPELWRTVPVIRSAVP